jgi:hypothetical protein
MITVSPGLDTRVWLSLAATVADQDRRTVSEQVVVALSTAGLRLVSSMTPQSRDAAERLSTAEPLYVAPLETPTRA